MEYMDPSTLGSRLDELIRYYGGFDDSKNSAHNISSSYIGPTARSSEMPLNVKAPSAGPFPQNAVAATTDCTNVAPNIVCHSRLNPNSSLLDNGLSASQRYLPNEHHRVVAHMPTGSGGNAMHCPPDKPGANIPQSVPVRSTHHNGGGFSSNATLTSPKQYIGFRDNHVLQSDCDKGRSSMSQMPSYGISNKPGGILAFNTNAVQGIDGAVTPEGCMDSDLYEMHLISAPGVSNRPASPFGFRGASKKMNPSCVYSNSTMNSAGVNPWLNQRTAHESPHAAKSVAQFFLMDTPKPCSEQGRLSQPRQLKREFQQSFPTKKQFDQLQQQHVSMDNRASGLPQAESILNSSLQIEGCFIIPDQEPPEPHTMRDVIQQPRFSLKGSASDGSLASSGVTVACESRKTSRAVQHDKLHETLFCYLHVMNCSCQGNECKVPCCMNLKQMLSHISCCSDNHCVNYCFLYQKLFHHFRECRENACGVCGPVRMRWKFFPQGAVTSDIPLSKAATPSIGTLDYLQPPLKRTKMENPYPSQSSRSETSQASPLIVDQTHSSQGLPHVCPEVSTPASSKTDSMKLDADPSASSSKESHAKFCEDKFEDSEEAIKVELGVEPVNSEEILVQCEEEKKQVQIEAGKLKVEVECKISASSAGHLLGTKPGNPKIKGLSLIDSFTPERVREHIRILRKLDDQKNAEAERNQGTERLKDNNTCSLCGMDKLLFEPPPRYCRLCSKPICPKGTFYSIISSYSTENGGDAQNSFCSKCYNISGDSIKAGGGDIPKANLERRWDYAETDAEAEWWVQCDKCEAWQHQICALFNGKRNDDVQAEYTCPSCFLQEIESGVCKPLPQITDLEAKNLPTTMLSDHIEQWLFRRLKKERQERANTLRKSFDKVPGAEDLVVRVVSSVDKKLEVKQHFRKIFHEEEYPAEFPYKSKAILLFQKIENADVCLFGMFVQEFGPECAFPNQRRVCISYIDSVKYFRPEIKAVTGEALRTFVYHEILIGYLDYCKKRGFTSCYIWSCPPLEKDDYILYCHPKTQKIPKINKLCEWYQTIIRKAEKEKIVVEHTNLYDHFLQPPSDCKVKVSAARLPYFDSDFWPGAAEDLLKKGVGSRSQKKGNKAAIDRVLRAAKRDSLTGNVKDILLINQLKDLIRPLKEDFIMVHLQHTCKHCCQPILSGNRWVCNVRKNFHLCEKCYTEQNLAKDRHTVNAREKYSYHKVEVKSIPADTIGKDELLQSEFFDTRMVFLSFCQANHYQFDTLRRAKHSTMMILYHLHNPTAPSFISSCVVCHHDIDTAQGWYCKTCPDYDLCDACYQREGAVQHHHELVSHATMAGCYLLPNKGTQQPCFQVLLGVLEHASKCTAPCCTYTYCRNLKRLFRHSSECRTRSRGGCKLCMQIWYLLQKHAQACKELECRVPRCKDLRDHKRKKQMQSDARRRAGVKERIRQGAVISGCSSN